MAKKSYDQRLKERWQRKQKQGNILPHDVLKSFPAIENVWAATAFILPFLFRKKRI